MLLTINKKLKLIDSAYIFYLMFYFFNTVSFTILTGNLFAQSLSSVNSAGTSWELLFNRSMVNSFLLSDDKRTLWVGTWGGLEERDAFTGKIRKIYTNQNGLPNVAVESLVADGKGGIWVGTGRGLAHFKADRTWEIFNDSNSDLPHHRVNTLLSDDQGGIWVGGETMIPYGQGITIVVASGLGHFKSDGTWTIFKDDNSGLPLNDVNGLVSDQQGGLWIATYKGLAHFKSDGSWDIFNSDNSGLPHNDINTIISDNQGGIWVGTTLELAHFKSDGTWEIFNEKNSDLPSADVNCIVPDETGGIWVATTDNRATCDDDLVHFKSDAILEVFNRCNSPLPSNTIKTLLPDGDGGVFIGTYDGIAHLRSDQSWVLYDEDTPQLLSNTITSIVSDEHNGIWIGTWGGVSHAMSDGSWKSFTINNSELPNEVVQVLALDTYNPDSIWIGTEFGLAHLDYSTETWKIFNAINSRLPGSNISSLALDDQGGIWVGTQGISAKKGLASLKPDGRWDVFNSENSELPDNDIQSLLYDNKRVLWIGTDKGLASIQPDGTWSVFDNNNSILLNNTVSEIASDGNGGIWVNCEALEHLKADGTWDLFDSSNSDLPNNDVRSILSDGKGGVWVVSRQDNLVNRLTQIEPDILAHLKADGTWDLFDQTNSDLPDTVGNLAFDGDGGIWAGNFNGLVHFMLIGSPDQVMVSEVSETMLNWFANRSIFTYQNVKYIELQRSLSKTGVYETVLDTSDLPIRFYADYSDCPNPRLADCWPRLEEHTPATESTGGVKTKGYTLNTPVIDPDWLEGLPRYYRLSAVIEDEDGKLARVANNSESTLVTPQVEEKPRVEITLDSDAIAMQPGTTSEITVFVSSLDLFTGEVNLEIESGAASSIASNIKAEIEPAILSLKPGKTEPVLLRIKALSQSSQSIKIIPGTESVYSGRSASLNVQVGDSISSMIALSIAHTTKRTRVVDALTVSGNVIPAQAGQEIVISGNNIMESAESATFTTDEQGNFEGFVTPLHAGLLTLTAQSDEIPSNTAEIFILPARTNIALTSNVNQSTKKGDTLRVQGIITPVRSDGTKVSLDIRYLDSADSAGGLQPQFVGDVSIGSNGAFYKDVVVPGDGFINIKAVMQETSDYLGVNTKLVIPVGQLVGEGIIVVSESGDVDFQGISKTIGQYVYNALINRNIPAERIKYLGLFGESAIATENAGNASKSTLHDSLTRWAVSMMSTEDPYKTPLNLYLIGQVEDGGFRLNESEVLTADELAQYLDEAEENLENSMNDHYPENRGFPVTILLEGAQSGQWIEKIAGNGRIILTSSSDRPLDEGGFAGYDNLGESSFSRYFYQFINYGSDIEGSFAEADYEILKFYRHTQRPVMDADGDGVGTTKFDRYEASGKFIEYRPSGNLRPQVRTTNPDMTIKRQRSSGASNSGYETNLDNSTLWAIATDPENDMQGVFCSITDPSGNTMNIEMNHDDRYFYSTRFEKYYQYPANGCYQVVYYAKDNAGNVSLPEQKFLNVISSGGEQEDTLQPPELIMSLQGSAVTLSWQDIPGADGFKLIYAPYPDGEYIEEIDMGVQKQIAFDGAGYAFYCAVKAYNTKGMSSFSNVEFFDLR